MCAGSMTIGPRRLPLWSLGILFCGGDLGFLDFGEEWSWTHVYLNARLSSITDTTNIQNRVRSEHGLPAYPLE